MSDLADRVLLLEALPGLEVLTEERNEALEVWRETRTIYAELGISNGIAECDNHLSRSGQS